MEQPLRAFQSGLNSFGRAVNLGGGAVALLNWFGRANVRHRLTIRSDWASEALNAVTIRSWRWAVRLPSDPFRKVSRRSRKRRVLPPPAVEEHTGAAGTTVLCVPSRWLSAPGSAQRGRSRSERAEARSRLFDEGDES